MSSENAFLRSDRMDITIKRNARHRTHQGAQKPEREINAKSANEDAVGVGEWHRKGDAEGAAVGEQVHIGPYVSNSKERSSTINIQLLYDVMSC